jgi:hypothetical protein
MNSYGLTKSMDACCLQSSLHHIVLLITVSSNSNLPYNMEENNQNPVLSDSNTMILYSNQIGTNSSLPEQTIAPPTIHVIPPERGRTRFYIFYGEEVKGKKSALNLIIFLINYI